MDRGVWSRRVQTAGVTGDLKRETVSKQQTVSGETEACLQIILEKVTFRGLLVVLRLCCFTSEFVEKNG